MKPGKIIAIAAIAILAAGVGLRIFAALATPSFPVAPLTITSENGVHKFTVEVAKSPAQQEYGLMFRTKMDADKGMIFVWDKPLVISMWMKNTILPLDMVFLDEGGKVTHVIANARPQSLDILSSINPAKAVIELNGGVAQKLGIVMGDQVDSPALQAAPAPKSAP